MQLFGVALTVYHRKIFGMRIRIGLERNEPVKGVDKCISCIGYASAPLVCELASDDSSDEQSAV